MPRKVFINYRRDDTAGYAGRIHDRLEGEFGADLLFMDVDTIPLGANFTEVLRNGIAGCDVLLALIGPNWLSIRDEEGNRRLDNPGDFLRIEIATALQRSIPIIPILLDGAKMPKADQLPKELKELISYQGLDIRHTSFHGDMDKLVRSLSYQPRIFVSPDKAVRALVFPSDINRDDARGYRTPDGKWRAPDGKWCPPRESRVEIRSSAGDTVMSEDYSSPDGEHGRYVNHGEWSPDSQFFVYGLMSSGGHSPWQMPIMVYSRQKERIASFRAMTGGPALSVGDGERPFKFVGPHTLVATTWKQPGALEDRVPISVDLNVEFENKKG
jgi:hypothetical protein